MNITKLVSVSIFFFLFLTTISLGEIQYEGLTFGETNGKYCRFGASGTKTKEAEQAVFGHLGKCAAEKRNPFLWDVGAPAGMTTVWRVAGDLNDIYKLVTKSMKAGAPGPNWIWANVSSPSIKINLNEGGSGWVDLIQDENIVGRLSCQCSKRDKQPKDGIWSIGQKFEEKHNGQIGRMSPYGWMAYAMEIKNSVEGIRIHSGSFLNESHGCVRLPEPGARSLRELLKTGSRVEIVYK